MTRLLEVDLDDTTACPLATSCEGQDCSTSDDLAVATAQAFAGVLCLTLCETCGRRPLPTFAPLEALTRTGRHCEHLGIDVDLMAEVLDTERGGAA